MAKARVQREKEANKRAKARKSYAEKVKNTASQKTKSEFVSTVSQAERIVAEKVKKGIASDMDKKKYSIYQKLAQNRLPDISKVSADITEYEKKYNDSVGSYKNDEEYDGIIKQGKELKRKLFNYSEYAELYDTKNYNLFNGLYKEIGSTVKTAENSKGRFKNQYEYDIALKSGKNKTYADYRQQIGALQRRRGTGTKEDDERIDAQLDWLYLNGLNNEAVLKSMTDDDWEYERKRAGSVISNAERNYNLMDSPVYLDGFYNEKRAEGLSDEEIKSEITRLKSKYQNMYNLAKEYDTDLNSFKTFAGSLKIKEMPDYVSNSSVDNEYLNSIIKKINNKEKISDSEARYYTANTGRTVSGNGGLPRGIQQEINAPGTTMTNEETQVYNYLFNKYGAEKADEYYENIKGGLNERYAQKLSSEAYQFGKEHPTLAFIHNLADHATGYMFNAVDIAENAYNSLTGKQTDINDITGRTKSRVSAMAQGGAEGSILGEWAYNTALNVSELLMDMFASKFMGSVGSKILPSFNEGKMVNTIYRTIMSSDVMADTLFSYQQQGMSTDEAFGMGIIAAAIEAITEKYSMERLMKTPDILKDVKAIEKLFTIGKKLGKDFAAEASEEGASKLLNSLANFAMNNKENDDFWVAYDEAKNKGMSNGKAFTQAMLKVAPDYASEMAAGGVAGMLFGGANTYQTVKASNKLRNLSYAHFKENGTERANITKFLIDNGISEETELATITNGIMDMAQGKTINKETEGKIKENPLYRGVLYGYTDIAEYNQSKEKSTVLNAESVNKPVTSEQIISAMDSTFSGSRKGRAGSQIYNEEIGIGSGNFVKTLISEGYSNEEAKKIADKTFSFMYEQGAKGRNMQKAVEAVSENIISGFDKTAELFYTAGKIDAANQMSGKKSAKLVNNAVLKSMYKAKKINHKTFRAINALASKLGVDIEFVDSIDGGHNASFDTKTGKLQISRQSKKPFITAAIHESVHAIRSIDSKSYNELKDITYTVLSQNKSAYKGAWAETYSIYKNEATDQDGKLNKDYISEEMTSEVISQLLTDEYFVNELAKTDRNLVQKIFDIIADFFDKAIVRYTDNKSDMSAEMKEAVKELRNEFDNIKKLYNNALSSTEAKRGVNMNLPKDGKVIHSDSIITIEDVKNIQNIGRKSINKLTEDEVKNLEIIAQKYWNGMSEKARIKSPFFRRWFGDWREFDKTSVNIVNLIKTTDTKKGTVKNNDSEFEINVSNVGIDHIQNHLHDSEFSKYIISHLDEITKNAVLLDTEISEKSSNTKHNNTMLMHNFYSVVNFNGEKIIVKLFVEEFYNEWNKSIQRRDYDLSKIKTITDGNEVRENNLTPLDAFDDDSNITVSDLFKLVKQYDREFKPNPSSLVINNDGTPKIVYHGTAEKFSEFLPNKFGSNTRVPSAKNAIFFTNIKNVAEGYAMDARLEYINELYRKAELLDNQSFYNGKHNEAESAWAEYEAAELDYDSTDEIVSGYINIKNPLVYDYEGSDFREKTFNDLINIAIKDHNDGVIFKNVYDGSNRTHDDLCDVYALFDPNNIKSVDNQGTFSSWSNDIYLSKNGGTVIDEDIEPPVEVTSEEINANAFELKKEIQDKLDKHIEKYGELEKGVNPVRKVNLPKKTDDDRFVRRGTRTVIESERVTNEIAEKLTEEIANGEFWTTYERAGDKKAQDTAHVRLRREGFDALYNEWRSIIESGKAIDKQDIVNAQLLMEEAAKNGNTELVVDIVSDIAAEATRAGQLVQSMLLLKKLGTADNVRKIQNTVKSLQKDLDKKFGKKAPDLEIPKNLLDEFAEVFEREHKAGDNDHSASDEIVDQIYEAVAKQIPTSWEMRFNTWRYFAMLGNFRTHIRNIFGNLVFQPAIFVKNLTAASLEGTTAAALKLAGKDMERSKTIKGVLLGATKQGAYKYAVNDAKKIEKILKGESKYGEADKILQKVEVYKKLKFLNKWTQTNSKWLEKEDWFFLKRHYARALTIYMNANKLTAESITDKQLEIARKYAIKEAQKATFRDESRMASALSMLSKRSKGLGIAVDSLLPFKKTPINILKRGIEYSPFGILKSLGKGIYDLKNGKYSAAEFIDGLGANLSGTGLLVFGIFFASQGILSGPGDDEEENKISQLIGKQNYSIKVGDATYTIDWMSPAAMCLFVGCEMWRALDDGVVSFADIGDALTKITTPLFDMSMLDGLTGILERASFVDGGPAMAAEILAAIPSNYLGQFVPTILGQAARTIDPVRRKTYIDKNSNIPQWVQSFAQQQAKKIPLLHSKLEPYTNSKGETELNAEGNILLRAFQNFLSPGYYKKIRSNEVDEEITRLYDAEGEDAKGIIPKYVEKSITVDGERVYLSDEQYTSYQQTTGQTYYNLLDIIVSSSYYKRINDEMQIDVFEKVKEFSVEIGKEAALHQYKSDTKWINTAKAMTRSEQAQFIYGRVLAAEDNGNELITNDKFISSNVKMELINYGWGQSDTPRQKYDDAGLGKYNISSDVFLDAYTKYKSFKEYKNQYGKTISKKKQFCHYVGSLNISNRDKSAIYRAFYDDRTENGKPNIKDVTWKYVWK